MSKRLRFFNFKSWLLYDACTCHSNTNFDPSIGRPPPPAGKKQDVTEIWRQELDKVVDYIEEAKTASIEGAGTKQRKKKNKKRKKEDEAAAATEAAKVEEEAECDDIIRDFQVKLASIVAKQHRMKPNVSEKWLSRVRLVSGQL